MPKINIKDNEPLERALRRFKKKIEREGTLRQVKARKHYEKPSVKKRRKIREARKKKKRFDPANC